MPTSFPSSTILPIFILLAFHHSLLSVEGLFGWNSNSKSSSSSVEHSDNSLSFNFELSRQRTKVEQSGSDEDAQAVQQQQQDGNSWGQSSQYSEYGSNRGNGGVGDSLSGGWNSAVGVQTYGNDMIQAENCDDDENNNNNDQNDGGNGGQQMATSTNDETNFYSNSNYSSNSNSNSNSSNSNYSSNSNSNSNSSNSNSNASLSEGDGNQQPGQGQTNSNSESYYYYNSYSNATNGRQGQQTSGSNSESNLDDGKQQPLTSTTESIYDASSNYNNSSSQQNYNYSYEYYSNSQNYTQNGGNSNSQQNYQYSYSQNGSSNSQNSQDGDNNSGNGDQQQNNVFEQYIKSLFIALTQSKEQTLRRQSRARLAACVHAISVLLWQGYKQLLVNNGTSCNSRDANGGSTASTCSKPELDDVALQLSQNEFGQQLNQTVDGNGPYGSSDGCVSADQAPTTEQLVAMIKQYSYTYELINGQSSGISINESSSESEITSAIGTIMRQTSQLQRQLQNDSKK